MAEYNSYHNQYVSGSVAYDYSTAAPDWNTGRQVDIPPARRVRDEVTSEKRAVTEQAVSPTAVLGLFLAAVLVVFSLFAKAQLNQVSLQVVETQTQLSRLESENQKLRIQYEYAFNLAQIEDYAVNELGMRQPYSDQMYYINSDTPDKAEVVTPEAPEGLLDRVISALGEYLG